MKISSKDGFSGIDELLSVQPYPKSASQMMNFKVERDGSLVRRRSKETVCEIDSGEIDSIWSGKLNNEEAVVFACNGKIYRIGTQSVPTEPTLIGSIENGKKCLLFDFNGMLYIKCGDFYGKYDGEALSEVEGYIPCVAMSCSPSGEGVILEQINLLSDKRRQLFSGTGTGVYYHLAEKDIDGVVSIKIDGVDYTDQYAVDSARGTVSFEKPPAEGLNNVEIIYTKAIPESDRRRFTECTRVMLFGGNSDGRAFFWGNPEYPNYRFHTDLADGIPSVEYFPVNAFTVIGNNKINCIVQQYDRQLIFAENEAFYSYCELKTDSLGNTYSSFPVFSLNGSKGCIVETDGCIIDNRPITLCNDGLNMWESTSVANEKNAICFSSQISDSLSKVTSLGKEVHLFDFQAHREFYFITRETAYVFNYSTGVWYKYDDFGGNVFTTLGKTLYFAKGGTLYAYGRDNRKYDSECYWYSTFINNGLRGGFCDIVKLEADVFVTGSVSIELGVGSSNGNNSFSNFAFRETSGQYARLSFRPAIKRCMPYGIFIRTFGDGECRIHGITVTIREKERSSRHELL